MKPTILVLASTFPRDNHDDGPRFIADFCLSLKHYYRVILLTQHRPGAQIAEDYDGIHVVRYRYAIERFQILSENGGISNAVKGNLFAILLVPCLVVAQIFAIKGAINKFQPAIVHAHWIFPQGLCAVLAQTRSINRLPLIVTSHGGDLYGLKGRVMNMLKKWIIGSCDKFCVVSSAMRRFVEVKLGFSGRDISVCPMGTDLELTFTPDESVTRISGQFLFVGRLVEKKGVEYLLCALKPLFKQQPETRLIIAGTGPELGKLRLLAKALNISEFVTFRGGVNHKSLVKLYRESEICVFPFIQSTDGDMEGLGLVVIEAMGCKCPVIVGNVPAVKDIVLHRKTGLVCDPKSKDSIVNKILEVQSNPSLKNTLVNTAYKYVSKNYSWASSTNRYVKVINDLIDL